MAPRNIPAKERRKAFKPKTKTGCQTCRIRRIKCDEARPSCSQCQRGCRKCDFISQDSSPASSLASTPRELQSIPLLISPNLLSNLFLSQQENRSFDFFIQRTIPQLGDAFVSGFWTQLVLQAAHHEPAVRHATIALGSLHESFEARSGKRLGKYPSSEEISFALSHYVKAIEFLVCPMKVGGKQMTDVALMTCVIFICFETLRGHHGAALSHIDGGTSIMAELQSSDCSSASNLSVSRYPYAPISNFELIFSRLDTQASQISFDRPGQIRNHKFTAAVNYSEKIPSSFTSLEQASDFLDTFRAQAMDLMKDIDPRAPDSLNQARSAMAAVQHFTNFRWKQWTSALEVFFQENVDGFSNEQRKMIQCVKMQSILMGLNTNSDIMSVLENEMVWDNFLPEFTAMVDCGHEINKISKEAGAMDRPSFTLNTEIVLPLFFVATKCRDGRVRREAIDVLKSVERQEGIFNSRIMARVADQFMETEERGLLRDGDHGRHIKTEDVVRENRIFGVKVVFDTLRRRAKLIYKSGGDAFGCYDQERRELGFNGAEGSVEW